MSLPPPMPDGINPVTKPSGFVRPDRANAYMYPHSTGLCNSTLRMYGSKDGEGWGYACGTDDGDGYGNGTHMIHISYNRTMP